ncbi:MAG: restriction endonuclease [Microthrixaceae bacterium]
MVSPAESGRQLEVRMAAFFAENGYETRLNAVLEGRSGGQHEVDVLADKADALTSFRVAVECKAWQQPIEKDVVSKLHYVVSDLGLNKGIVVSTGGWRSGAQRTAADLGIELWGPDELARHLGEPAAANLGASIPAPGTKEVTGLPVCSSRDAADRLVRSAGKGRLNLLTREELAWFTQLWVPGYCVRLTVAREQQRRLRSRLSSVTSDGLYEALSGTYLGPAPTEWSCELVEPRLALPASVRETKVHGALRAALRSYQKVTSAPAVQRHEATLHHLGVPVPCASLSIESTHPVHLPYWVGILQSGAQQRVVAVDAHLGTESEPMSAVLTANLPQIRAHFAA